MKKTYHLSANKHLKGCVKGKSDCGKVKMYSMLVCFAASLLSANTVFALADLEMTATSVQDKFIPAMQGKPRSGNCNTVTVNIRNIGDVSTQGVFGQVITFPTATPQQNRNVKQFLIAPLRPGRSVTRVIQQVVFPAGTATLQAVINTGPGRRPPENNDDNNFQSRRFTVSIPCTLPRRINNRGKG